ncbi:hypothetical protein D3C86_2110580 [compost metagenome]
MQILGNGRSVGRIKLKNIFLHLDYPVLQLLQGFRIGSGLLHHLRRLFGKVGQGIHVGLGLLHVPDRLVSAFNHGTCP